MQLELDSQSTIDLHHCLPFSPVKTINLSVAAVRNPPGLRRITALLVTPTLTHDFDIVSVILSQSIHVFSDILAAILSDILFDIYSAILSGILSDTYPDTLFGSLSGILF